MIKIFSRSILISLLLYMFLPAVWAAGDATIVTGKVINGKDYIIRLMTWSDQVSYDRITLKSDTVGADERFSFTLDILEVKYCWLDLEFQQGDIFLQPGQVYDVEIEMQAGKLSSSYYNRTVLPVKFIKDDNDHLNLSIQDYNQLYNDFLLNYAEKIKSQNAKQAFETFNQAIDLRFQNNNNPFFRNYILYKSASMQLFMRLQSRDNVGLEYLTGRPVLYDHPEYMDFFHLFFEKYFLTTGKHFTYNKSYDLINGTATSSDILDSLTADPVLKDIAIRELLLLDGLKELYNVSGFKRTRIISLIGEIATDSKIEKSRQLADALLISLVRLQPGTPAPDFTLPKVGTIELFSLSDFKGKKVYLAFFESGNPASQSELGMIKDFYDKYKDKVYFVAISVDKDMGPLIEYLNKADLPWLFLHYGGNLELLENYDANTFPYFLLINENGQIKRCPAPSPSENIQKLFDAN